MSDIDTMIDRLTPRQQREYALTHNLHSGWVAFLEDQTEENLKPRCEKCGKECGA